MSDENAGHHVRVRTVGMVHGTDGSAISVDHVFLPEGAFTCDDCGEPGHDPGGVGLFLDEGEEGSPFARALLTPEEALVLANRLQRAASLVLESLEDVADIEREAARFKAEPAH